MTKLSEAMIKGLRAIADGRPLAVSSRTITALRDRFMVKAEGMAGAEVLHVLTQTGRDTLDRIEREAEAKADEAERLSRPVPAGAFVEPAAKRAPVLDHEYEDDYEADPAAYERAVANAAGAPAVEAEPIERATFRPADEITMTTGDSGPSVRLTPAPADTKREATDAEVLQLLAMLDAGGIVHRALYQEFGVLGIPFIMNLEAVNRAARDAVRFGLARQTFTNHEYVLTVEPIHLDEGTGSTACARHTGERADGTRLRVTTDPDKVTHGRCRPIKAGDVVTMRHATSGRTYDVTEVDPDGDYARVWWNNHPEDYADEITGQWVPVARLERVTT